jgi:hypothetical protein
MGEGIIKMKIKNSKLKIVINFLIIFGILFPSFAYLQNQNFAPPESLEELKQKGGVAMGDFLKNIPQTLKIFWEEDIFPIWLKIYKWCKKTFWDPYLGPFFQKEIEKRKPGIEEEFKKEMKETKESAKTEVPEATKSLWQRLKELFK